MGLSDSSISKLCEFSISYRPHEWSLSAEVHIQLFSLLNKNNFYFVYVFVGTTHRTLCTSKQKIPICRLSTSIRSSIRSRIVTESNLSIRCLKTTRNSFSQTMFSHFCKTLRCTPTTQPMALRFCGLHVRST